MDWLYGLLYYVLFYWNCLTWNQQTGLQWPGCTVDILTYHNSNNGSVPFSVTVTVSQHAKQDHSFEFELPATTRQNICFTTGPFWTWWRCLFVFFYWYCSVFAACLSGLRTSFRRWRTRSSSWGSSMLWSTPWSITGRVSYSFPSWCVFRLIFIVLLQLWNQKTQFSCLGRNK